MSKNAFELRFEALQLAHGSLVEQYNARKNKIELLKELECNGEAYEELRQLIYPTEKDVFELAERMSRFIDGKRV